MTLQTPLSDKVIDAMFRYLGDSFMCDDQRGKTVGEVVARYEPQMAERIIGKIALMVLGANLPGQKSQIRMMKFEK